MRRLMVAGGAALLLAACKPAPEPRQATALPAQPAFDNTTSRTAVADPWAGRWLGPEGLFLHVEPTGEGAYRLTLKDNLDSQAEYDGQVQGGGLVFARKGETVVVRPGTGAQTGFKYLADKTDCLIVVPSREGYCRG